jgi:hypothetical protein
MVEQSVPRFPKMREFLIYSFLQMAKTVSGMWSCNITLFWNKLVKNTALATKNTSSVTFPF